MAGLVMEAKWTPRGESVRFDEATEKARSDLLGMVAATVEETEGDKRDEMIVRRRGWLEGMSDPVKIKSLWSAVQGFREALPGNGGDNGPKVLGLYFVLQEAYAEAALTVEQKGAKGTGPLGGGK